MSYVYDKWMWWVGSDDEHFDSQFETKEEAIECGRDEYGEGFYIVEAITPTVKLSKCIHVDRMLEDAEDHAQDIYGNPDDCQTILEFGECEQSFEDFLTEAIDKWQEENNQVFKTYRFSQTRNMQHFGAE